MTQSVAVMLFTANALVAWALVVQALRLGSRHGAGVFVAMGATLALLTTVMLVQAQVTNHDTLVALVRTQLALRSVIPALWLIALIRWAAPPFIHRAHVLLIAIPALVFATAALVRPSAGRCWRASLAHRTRRGRSTSRWDRGCTTRACRSAS